MIDIGGYSIWYIGIIALLGFAIFGSGSLAMSEYTKGNVCPKIFNIPACYLVLLFFLMGFLTHFSKSKLSLILFFTLISMLGILALAGAIGELTGSGKCPRTSGGMPMCYISLAICLVTLIFKYLDLSINNY